MTDLFTPEGHLTDEALKALIHDELDELGRLEAGEHLSFCDQCLDRYMALLTPEVLEEPETDLVLPVMRKNSSRARRQTLRRWASAAAAVAIGSTLFYTGVFQQTSEMLQQRMPEVPPQSQTEPFQKPEADLGNAILKAVDEWSIWVRQKAAPAYRAPAQRNFNETNEIGG